MPVSTLAINNSMSSAKCYLPAFCSIGHLIPAALGMSSLLALYTLGSNCILIHAHLNGTSLKTGKELCENTTKVWFLNY